MDSFCGCLLRPGNTCRHLSLLFNGNKTNDNIYLVVSDILSYSPFVLEFGLSRKDYSLFKNSLRGLKLPLLTKYTEQERGTETPPFPISLTVKDPRESHSFLDSVSPAYMTPGSFCV